MTYATANDLVTRFAASEMAQRADRGETRLVTAALMRDAAAGTSLAGYTADQQAAAAAALAVLQMALDDARDTIDACISGRYTLPLEPVPPLLVRVACNLARRHLYDDQVTEAVQDAADVDMKLLYAVRDGKASLGADAATGQQPASSASAELVTKGRVWDRTSSRDFI